MEGNFANPGSGDDPFGSSRGGGGGGGGSHKPSLDLAFKEGQTIR
jgi:hypothetical protein